MKRARQEDTESETLPNSINVDTVGSFAQEWMENKEWQTEVIVRRIYLVNGLQRVVKLIIDTKPHWRFVDFLGTNWSIVQHERCRDLYIEQRDCKWQGSTDETHMLILDDIAHLRTLMECYHVKNHDSIYIVKSIIPFEVVSFKNQGEPITRME